MPTPPNTGLRNLQDITNSGQPSWASAGAIPTSQGLGSFQGSSSLGEVADVPAGQARINVVRPDMYDKPTAAHEATHVFQNSRNDQFNDREHYLLPLTSSLSDYNYGGVKGLQANPRKTVTDYNPEQQASMVEDLTSAQGKLTTHMSKDQLNAWDATKNTLERPLQQLIAVPAQDNSVSGKIDHYLHVRGFGDPISQLKGILSPPTMNTSPQPVPSAPSAALGYANRSKLVR